MATSVYLVTDAVLELPWSVYSQWWREKVYGLTSQALAGWFTDQAIALFVAVLQPGRFFDAALCAHASVAEGVVGLGERTQCFFHHHIRGSRPGYHRAPFQSRHTRPDGPNRRRGGPPR
jgi:hypothetical protein